MLPKYIILRSLQIVFTTQTFSFTIQFHTECRWPKRTNRVAESRDIFCPVAYGTGLSFRPASLAWQARIATYAIVNFFPQSGTMNWASFYCLASELHLSLTHLPYTGYLMYIILMSLAKFNVFSIAYVMFKFFFPFAHRYSRFFNLVLSENAGNHLFAIADQI